MEVSVKFKRINEDTVRCIISKEDMQEYNISLEDFFKNKGKIHDFLHIVVEKAEQEVGYEPKDGLLSMQIIPLSPNTISITFTENENEDLQNILGSLKDSFPELENVSSVEDIMELKESGDIDSEELEEILSQGISDMEDDEDEDESLEEKSKNVKKQDIKPIKSNIYDRMLITMDSIEDLAKYCKAAGVDKTVKSDLYQNKMTGVFNLIIEKERLSAGVFRHMLVLATEFTNKITDSEEKIAHIREHDDCIILKKAYRILKKYL